MNIVVVIVDALGISIKSAISLFALLALAIDNEVTISWVCCFFSNCVGILHVSRVLLVQMLQAIKLVSW